MVVGGGHRHDLLRADHRADRGEPHRVADRAGGDDRALAVHQARYRGDRAEAAGVGERDVGALQVVGGERVGARLLDERVVGAEEALEGHVGGVLDHRHHQRAAAVLLLHVHREAEVHLSVADAVGPPVDLGEVVRHHRHVGCRARDRVGDQVGERHLASRRLQLAPASVERGDGERAEAGGGGDRARLVHVAGERRRAALHQLRARGRGSRGWGGGRRGCGGGGRRRCGGGGRRRCGVGGCRGCGGGGRAVTGGGAEHVGLDDAPAGPLPETVVRSTPSTAAARAATGVTGTAGADEAEGADGADGAPLGSRSKVGRRSRLPFPSEPPLRAAVRPGGRVPTDGDPRDHLADGDRVALLRQGSR